jgi:hypothetical protein
MAIVKLYAQLSCNSLSVSEAWFSKLFGRSADAHPMQGLAEWHHSGSAGLQLFEDRKNAGRGTMTLIVSDLSAEHARLKAAGLAPSDIEPADTTSLVMLRDPDNNLVVFAQPGPA